MDNNRWAYFQGFYITLLIINGDEAYAGIIGDVLSYPRGLQSVCQLHLKKKGPEHSERSSSQIPVVALAFVNYVHNASLKLKNLWDRHGENNYVKLV